MKYKLWTEEEIELLELWCKQGWNYKDIANELNRSRKSIEEKCRKLNISNNLKIKLKTHAEYINELNIKCPSMIYLENYINSMTPILHKCLECGKEYKCTPHTKLRGYKCKYCKIVGNIPKYVSSITYLIYIPKYKLFKIGFTTTRLKERLRHYNVSYEIILERYFNNSIEAINLEKEWLSNIENYKVNTGLLNSGNTETFRY